MRDPRRLAFHLNLYRLAGLPRVLGIEIDDQEVRAVEVERMGLVTREASFLTRVLWGYTLRLEGGETPEEIGARLKTFLEAMHSTTQRAVLGLRPQAVRIVRTQVPDGVERIRDWIEDNSDKLLGLPIPVSELAFEYQDVPHGAQPEATVDIAFVRRVEVEKLLAICRAANLVPLAVGVGRDMQTAQPQSDLRDEYRVARRLAESGFDAGDHSFDFLPAALKEEGVKNLWRRVTKRVGAAAATLLLVALLSEFLASVYVSSREVALEESLTSSKASLNEVTSLEQDVQALEERVAAVRLGTDRTELARAMHDVASVHGQGIRFHRLAIVEKKSGGVSFAVSAEAPSHGQLAAFISSLDSAGFCKDVVLLKSGSGEASSGQKALAGAVLFDLEGQIR
jgi:hypothetical protein